jgi:hypothetical protein
MLTALNFLSAQVGNSRINQPGSSPEEVAIAVNPKNPDNLVAGANLKYVFTSFDGGKTWNEDQLPAGTYGDPCVIFDAEGRAFYAHLTYGWDAITVRYSDDGGKTWPKTVKLFGPSSDSARPGSYFESSLQDKEWLCADMTNSPYRNNIYASWTDFTRYGGTRPQDSSVIVFARSTNRGESWEKYVRISDTAGDCIDDDNTMEGAVPAVGPNGEVYVAWSGPDGLYFDRSLDGGKTWGKDRILTATPGGWAFDISGISRCNGLPITCADISSSPYRGNIYINWVDFRNGDPDVFIMRSSDAGNTWGTPIRVNDDPVGNGKDQFFTWMAVDPKTGEISIVYYDRRNYNSDSTDVFLAHSVDGGASFVNSRISRAAFYPTAMVFFGDYNGISAYNGRIRPIWTNLDNGELDVYTALIDPETGINDKPPAPESGQNLHSYPNPVTSSCGYETQIRFTLLHSGRVHLSVNDCIGRSVATLVDKWMSAGEHTVSFDAAHLAPGVYFCRLLSGDTYPSMVQTRLITLLR